MPMAPAPHSFAVIAAQCPNDCCYRYVSADPPLLSRCFCRCYPADISLFLAPIGWI
jgi:hypothetical protein